jgi:ABC-type transporter Mla MlaB component
MNSSPCRKPDDKLYLSIEGKMTEPEVEGIKLKFNSALVSGKGVEFDLSQVTELDSAGLQLMVSTKLESIVRGIQVDFIKYSSAVRAMVVANDSEVGDADVLITHWILCLGCMEARSNRTAECDAILQSKYRALVCKDVKNCMLANGEGESVNTSKPVGLP